MKSHTKSIVLAFALIFGLFISFTSFVGYASACQSQNNDCFPPVDGSCYANVSRAEVGQEVTWRATVSGGNDFYSFYWSGTDGLTSLEPGVYKTYSRPGTKTATVEITSYGQTITRTCTVIIEDEEEEENDNLSGYCEAVSPSNPEVGDRVTWRATANGGDGDYDYDWSGSESLDGDDRTIYKEYDNDGRKTATVRISSDGDSITKTCYVNIDEEEDDDNDDLDAYCKASPSRGDEGDRIKWTVYAEGGDGDYDYEWDGDDNLSGDDKSIYHTYDRSGNYDAEVEVESDGDRVTARCDVDIDDEDRDDDDKDDGIYLSSIPATGISPTMKTGLFATGVVLWSAFLGYLYVSRRNEKKREQEILNSLK